MIRLPKSLKHWGRDDFADVIKKELLELGANSFLPQEAATPGTFVNDSEIGITVLTSGENKSHIKVKLGVMFAEVQWGYCCGEEEPMISNAYCEICVSLNKNTSQAEFTVL